MKCKTLHKKIIFFLEEELPADEMEQMKYHLSVCNDCNAFAEEMAKMLAVLQTEKAPSVNPFFYTRLKAKIENLSNSKIRYNKNPFFVKILQPALFSVLLIAGIYSGIKIGQPISDRTSYYVDSEQEIIPYLNEMKNETIELFLME